MRLDPPMRMRVIDSRPGQAFIAYTPGRQVPWKPNGTWCGKRGEGPAAQARGHGVGQAGRGERLQLCDLAVVVHYAIQHGRRTRAVGRLGEEMQFAAFGIRLGVGGAARSQAVAKALVSVGSQCARMEFKGWMRLLKCKEPVAMP